MDEMCDKPYMDEFSDLTPVWIERFKYEMINNFEDLSPYEIIFICDSIDNFVAKNARIVLDGTAHINSDVFNKYCWNLIDTVIRMKEDGVGDG